VNHARVSAGANPGPACYRRGGPLAVTDCNVMLGKIQPAHFPSVFGPAADEPLDAEVVHEKFAALARKIATATAKAEPAPEEVAEGFLRIAVENMANAIKKISVQRGYDVTEYTLQCFGGAGGQHACDIADTLGMTRIFLHPYAGVLSAYGMGLADLRALREQAVEKRLGEEVMSELREALGRLEGEARAELESQQVDDDMTAILRRVHLRYEGTDSALIVEFGAPADVAGPSPPFASSSPKRAKKSSAIFFAVPSIRRAPTWASLPPTSALTV